MSNQWNDLWCKDTFWECTEVDSGRWIAICKELGLTLQDDSFLMLIQQIQDILSCELIQEALEASRVHLSIPKTIFQKIYETYHTPRSTHSRRVQ
jgi:hypothetical protein